MPQITPTDYQKLIKIFEAGGCQYVRTVDKQVVEHYPGAMRPVVIPKYHNVPVSVIRNNMKVIGMSRETFFKLMETL